MLRYIFGERKIRTWIAEDIAPLNELALSPDEKRFYASISGDKTLYIAARQSVYKIRLNIAGIP